MTDNKWESIREQGDQAIEEWIEDQLHGRSCTIVLVGSYTAGRKWIEYEIERSWEEDMGVVGIYIHGLKNRYGYVSRKGRNPFEDIKYRTSNSRLTKRLSSIVKCYDPVGGNSAQKYAWICGNLASIVERAISIREKTQSVTFTFV